MAARDNQLEPVTSAATLAAGAMIAHQVGAKATRDALFLSNFEVAYLPTMLIAASVASIFFVLAVARIMQRVGPGWLVPRAFLASGVLLLIEYGLTFVAPAVTAVLVYLHIAAFGAILISAFWSLVNEQFDPRSGKKAIGRIGAGGTLGGLLGGLVAERAAAWLSVTGMLPMLAALHLFCAWRVLRLGLGSDDARRPARADADTPDAELANGLHVLAKQPYLRNLAALVLLGTVAAALLDYVFKAEAVAAFDDGEELLRFFAFFYTGVSFLTFVVQSALANLTLKNLGLARTVATLPCAVAAGGLGVLLVPGLVAVTAARASESVLRSSLYRSGYELLYTPIPSAEKRATKTLVDVGFDRLGDAVGGGLTMLVLATVATGSAHPMLIATSGALGVGALAITRRLHRGYVQALEHSLVTRAVELDLDDVEDQTTRSTVLQTMGTLDIREALLKLSNAEGLDIEAARAASETTARAPSGAAPAASAVGLGSGMRFEPVVQTIVELRSGDPERIAAILADGVLSLQLVPHALPLLAWDEVSERAVHALRRIAKRITGQLVDALLDQDEEFAIRRRIPRVLCWALSQRAVDGMLLGLADRRFEVRFQCGRGLSYMLSKEPRLEAETSRVFEAVLREARVDKRVWESHRLLDQFEDEGAEMLLDEYLRDRSNRSLEHVFTMLSLVLPRQPLTLAYRGLHTNDAGLRGTALEYLESVLPPAIRQALWPFLEGDGPRLEGATARDRDLILDELMRSNKSIQLNLEALRRRFDE